MNKEKRAQLRLFQEEIPVIDALLNTTPYDKRYFRSLLETRRATVVTEMGRLMRKSPTKKTLHWFAASKHIARMGPYKTQVAAWRALELPEYNSVRVPGTFSYRDIPRTHVHMEGAHVWPEYKP